MRVIFPLMLIVFGILLVGFIVTNPDQPVSVTLAGQTYQTSLLLVIVVSLTAGAVFVGVIALIEGWTIRLGNHKAQKRIQQLETENGFLRSEIRNKDSSRAEAGEASGATKVRSPVRSPAPVYDPAGRDAAQHD